MKTDQRYVHVVVSCDKKERSLSFSTAESSDAVLKGVEVGYREIAKISIEDLLSAGSEKAKSTIGAILIANLDKGALFEFDSSDVGAENVRNDIEYLLDLMTERANQGDVRAQEFLASDCLVRSLSSKNLALLDDAEMWYRKAAMNGSKSAMAVIDRDWPKVYAKYREQIERSEE